MAKTGEVREAGDVFDEPRLKEFHMVGNSMTATFATENAKDLASAYLQLCDDQGAQNYLEMRMHDNKGREVIVTVQRGGQPTPHMLRTQAEAKAATLSAEVERLQARLGEAEADAGRYRWLRKNIWWSPAGSGEVRWVTYLHMLEPPTSDAEMSEDSTAQSLDADIDAAIGGTGDA